MSSPSSRVPPEGASAPHRTKLGSPLPPVTSPPRTVTLLVVSLYILLLRPSVSAIDFSLILSFAFVSREARGLLFVRLRRPPPPPHPSFLLMGSRSRPWSILRLPSFGLPVFVSSLPISSYLTSSCPVSRSHQVLVTAPARIAHTLLSPARLACTSAFPLLPHLSLRPSLRLHFRLRERANSSLVLPRRTSHMVRTMRHVGCVGPFVFRAVLSRTVLYRKYCSGRRMNAGALRGRAWEMQYLCSSQREVVRGSVWKPLAVVRDACIQGLFRSLEFEAACERLS